MPAVAVVLTSSNYCYQFVPEGSIWPPGQIYSLINPDEGNEDVPWMNLTPQSRLLCSWQGLSICLVHWPCLCQTTWLDPAYFLMERGRKALGHHWRCILWTPENPGEKVWWKEMDSCCGTHYYLTWRKPGGSAPASATWDVKGRKECVIMWWFGATEMCNDCWWQQLHFSSRSVNSRLLSEYAKTMSSLTFNSLNVSCFLSKFYSICQVCILKEPSHPEEK